MGCGGRRKAGRRQGRLLRGKRVLAEPTSEEDVSQNTDCRAESWRRGRARHVFEAVNRLEHRLCERECPGKTGAVPRLLSRAGLLSSPQGIELEILGERNSHKHG